MTHAPLTEVAVDLGTRSYRILVGAEAMKEAGALHVDLGLGFAFIVTDAKVDALHGETLRSALVDAGVRCQTFKVPEGENSKTFSSFEHLSERLIEAGLTRDAVIYALGGGAVGDLAGFVAATALRGVDFVQIPTTLLAQVDSSVGGKTGINTTRGKNLVGVFHQPRFVLADTNVLASLPERELRSGYAEVVKYALLGNATLFDWLETNGEALLAGDENLRSEAIRQCCEMKARIVVRDEKEQGERALLNLGHTFGHALEVEKGFDGSLLHGEAVAAGLVMAFQLSARLGFISNGEVDRIVAHLQAVGLPPSSQAALGRAWKAETAIAHIRSDKKMRGDRRIAFILVRGIGEAFLSDQVTAQELEDFLIDEGKGLEGASGRRGH